MTLIEEIYEAVLAEMAVNNIPDTPANRLEFLQGLSDAWKEDPDTSLEKLRYQMALTTEIFTLILEVRFPTLVTPRSQKG